LPARPWRGRPSARLVGTAASAAAAGGWSLVGTSGSSGIAFTNLPEGLWASDSNLDGDQASAPPAAVVSSLSAGSLAASASSAAGTGAYSAASAAVTVLATAAAAALATATGRVDSADSAESAAGSAADAGEDWTRSVAEVLGEARAEMRPETTFSKATRDDSVARLNQLLKVGPRLRVRLRVSRSAAVTKYEQLLIYYIILIFYELMNCCKNII